MQQRLENLPQELLEQPRFFPLRDAGDIQKLKAGPPVGWNKRENQSFANDVQYTGRTLGFDITAREPGEPSFVVFDFDNVLDDDGNFVNIDAEDTYHSLLMELGETFVERSARGHGLHVLACPESAAEIGRGIYYFTESGENEGANTPKLEVYSGGRGKYFLFTGDCWQCEPGTPIVGGERALAGLDFVMGEIRKQQGQQASDNEATDKVRNPGMDRGYDLARASAMLDCIDAASCSYEDWLYVGIALHNIGADASAWDLWSATDPARYHPGECMKKWEGFGKHSGRPITIATLHALAKRGGYDDGAFMKQWREDNKGLGEKAMQEHSEQDRQESMEQPEWEAGAPTETDEDILKEMNGILHRFKDSRRPDDSFEYWETVTTTLKETLLRLEQAKNMTKVALYWAIGLERAANEMQRNHMPHEKELQQKLADIMKGGSYLGEELDSIFKSISRLDEFTENLFSRLVENSLLDIPEVQNAKPVREVISGGNPKAKELYFAYLREVAETPVQLGQREADAEVARRMSDIFQESMSMNQKMAEIAKCLAHSPSCKDLGKGQAREYAYAVLDEVFARPEKTQEQEAEPAR